MAGIYNNSVVLHFYSPVHFISHVNISLSSDGSTVFHSVISFSQLKNGISREIPALITNNSNSRSFQEPRKIVFPALYVCKQPVQSHLFRKTRHSTYYDSVKGCFGSRISSSEEYFPHLNNLPRSPHHTLKSS